MPWNSVHFPVSMRHLSQVAREKAIAIANALLAEGMNEGKAIRIAIAKAKSWACDHQLPAGVDRSKVVTTVRLKLSLRH